MNLLSRSLHAAALAAATLFVAPAAQAADANSPLTSLALSRTQAEALDRAMPGRVIWVDVDCCEARHVDDAVATAEMFRIVGGMSKAAPVFVTGRDATQNARTARRLIDAGMALVFLVADDRLATSDDALETP
jgi:hypothetical protein